MYHGRPSLRWLTYLGTIGLAALGPARGRLPVWLAVGLAVLPIALYELGAGIADEAASERWRRRGVRTELAGALAYLGLLGAAAGSHLPLSARAFALLLALASLGALAAVVVWWDHLALARGELPVAADPLGAGERLASASAARGGARRLADVLAVTGGTPLLVGGIALAFVVVAAVALARRPGPAGAELGIALAFFAGSGLVALSLVLERWEAFVPGSRVRRLRLGVQVLSFLLFGGALLAIGVVSLDDPRASRARAVFMIAGGGLCLAGGVAFAWRLGGGRAARAGYDLAREGLLERTRRGAFLYPWEAIAAVTLGEFQHHLALLVLLAGDERVEGPLPAARLARSHDTDARLARRRRGLRHSRTLFGADVIVLDATASVSVGDLYRAATAALGDPAARATFPSVAELLSRAR